MVNWEILKVDIKLHILFSLISEGFESLVTLFSQILEEFVTGIHFSGLSKDSIHYLFFL